MVELCNVLSSMRVAGVPPVITVVLHLICLAGPITVPDATPRRTPGVSPMVNGIVVDMLCEGMKFIKCFMEVVGGNAVTFIAKFGYGMGIGAGKNGVIHTSGNPKSIPGAIEQFANILSPFRNSAIFNNPPPCLLTHHNETLKSLYISMLWRLSNKTLMIVSTSQQ
ncbi:hypothetical protein MTBBW1_80226 [Desulfamplus magnetovallimortis]|uniref:Uncharacterized protein n=1 Tax=Desulfamplus magnetovallimortis TaxID=1246637 RepID=L0R5N0_9BACT|nr:hypothetical protein DEMABW1_80226 [Desulfamplus magnetovallimortis BW-1]SLM32883.1 hypothetical protein MTBBW1_80226 [Desulfamplus magnetovallimortis]